MTQDELKELIDYNPETGVFTWPHALANQARGKQAGIIERKGYRQIMIKGQRLKAHRIAWFYMTGEWPSRQIDHINGDKDDNRFANLRQATNSDNKRNSPVRVDNVSGLKCVATRTHPGKWCVVIKFPGARQQKHCGCFNSAIDAAVAANYNLAYGCGPFAKLNEIPEGVWGHD